jgi:hypothetical protein
MAGKINAMTGPRPAMKPQRKQRLAAALKANLKRRKAQEKQRSSADAADPTSGSESAHKPNQN